MAGRPGTGKTALGLQIAHNVARRKSGHVVIFSAEMSVESLIWRAIAEVTNVPPANVEGGTVPQAVRERILEATEYLATLPVAIDDTGGITTEQMVQRVQRYQKRFPVDLVLFDYLELAGDKPPRSESEERRVGQISQRMKALARICNVPVIVLCQLNRAVEQRRNRTPTLADLRYSGGIEADADQVLLLYREDYYVSQGLMEPTPGKQGTCDVILAKQRNGTTGTFPIRFYPDIMAFSDIDMDRSWLR
jgi:replicative DNA helicase